MAMKLLRHRGMVPEIQSWERSKIWRDASSHYCNGMLPTNRFDGRQSTIKSNRLVPIHAGILSKSLFSPKSNSSNEEQFINDIGSSPKKLLFWKCNVRWLFSEQILAKDLGILPERLLFAKLRTLSVTIFAQHLGSSPDNKLFERSR